MAHVHTMEWILHGACTYYEMDIPWFVHEPWNILFMVRGLWNIHSIYLAITCNTHLALNTQHVAYHSFKIVPQGYLSLFKV